MSPYARGGPPAGPSSPPAECFMQSKVPKLESLQQQLQAAKKVVTELEEQIISIAMSLASQVVCYFWFQF